MQTIIDRLFKTYDTKFLDNKDPHLVKEIYANIDTFSERKVLRMKEMNREQPSRSHNIILYASKQRSDKYRDFLKYIGFKMISSTTKSNFDVTVNSYLDIREFPMSFFSHAAIDKYYDDILAGSFERLTV